MLIIKNDGKDIKSANYWESAYAKNGFFYMSGNDNALRLLVPPSKMEIATVNASEAIISRGPWPPNNGDAIEVMLEDGTDAPYCVHFGKEQCDLLPEPGQEGLVFSLWGPGPKKLVELPCRYRHAPILPWLKPWESEEV